MRPRLIALVVTVAALVCAGAALGAFVQRSSTRLSTSRAGRPTGVLIAFTLSDATAPGGKPRILRRVQITLPAGTRVRLTSRRCRLTDRQLTTELGPRCPRASAIGTGTATANIAPIAPFTVAESVSAYVRGARQIILLLTPRLPADLTMVVPITVAGSRLTLTVPRVVWQKTIHVAQVSLRLSLPAPGHAGAGQITAGRCTGGRFVVGERFVYATPGATELRTSSPCR